MRKGTIVTLVAAAILLTAFSTWVYLGRAKEEAEAIAATNRLEQAINRVAERWSADKSWEKHIPPRRDNPFTADIYLAATRQQKILLVLEDLDVSFVSTSAVMVTGSVYNVGIYNLSVRMSCPIDAVRGAMESSGHLGGWISVATITAVEKGREENSGYIMSGDCLVLSPLIY